MELESVIEAVRNRKTQKLFIVVDDTLEMRFRVINPAGEVLILPDALFEDDMISVPADQFQAEFTTEQLTALRRFNEQVAAQAPLMVAPITVDKSDAPTKRRDTPRKAKAPSSPSRRGLGASWSAPRLTFYRHKIDPLHAKQTFRITVDGHGEFEFSKEDFLAQFNDVVMSPSYRSDGLYSYPALPDKAHRFRKS